MCVCVRAWWGLMRECPFVPNPPPCCDVPPALLCLNTSCFHKCVAIKKGLIGHRTVAAEPYQRACPAHCSSLLSCLGLPLSTGHFSEAREQDIVFARWMNWLKAPQAAISGWVNACCGVLHDPLAAACNIYCEPATFAMLVLHVFSTYCS